MTGAAILALWSHWRRRKGQFAALVAGLALATALWTGVQAINAEARAAYDRAARQVGEAALPRVTRDGGVRMSDFVALRRGGWLVSPVVEGRITLNGERLRLLGIDPLTAPQGIRPQAMEPGAETAPTDAPLLYAAPDLACRVGVRPAAGLPAGVVVTEVTEAQRRLDTDAFSRLVLLPDQPLRQTPLAEIGPYRIAQAPPQPDLSRLTDSFHLNLQAFGLLAFAVGLFVVHGAIGLAFEERRAMIRTLRALGLPLARLGLVMTAELVALALIGGGLGVVLGGALAAALLPDVAASLGGLYGAEVPGALTIRPVWWLSGLGMALAGTLIAGGGALWHLARLPLLAPARPRAWARSGERLARAGGLAGLVLLAGAGAVLAVGHGLLAGFVALGGLMLGAAALLPALTGAALAMGERLSRGALARWVWADTRQQLPGLSLALMALMLALAANLGVSTMVGSFRETFLGWLDQRLAADLYVIARDPQDAARLEAWLTPRVDAVLPIWRTEADVAGYPVTLYGFRDDPSYRRDWPVLTGAPDLWDRAAAGDGVLVNEQMARHLNLTPGAPLALPGWQTTVLGTYSDYGNPTGQVMMALDRLVTLFPQADRLRFGLVARPGTVADLTEALVRDYGLPAENVTDQAAQKRAAVAVFDRTFLVTGALNVLTLGVAAFAMLTALVTLSGLRLPQLAPVWAMGLTRRRLAALELLRAALLAALAFAVALPVGLALAWVLLAVINVEAFGWRLPMHLYPGAMLRLLVAALVAAGLAALLPALRLMRRPPADLLRVFAGAR